MTSGIEPPRRPVTRVAGLRADAHLIALDALIVAAAYVVALVLRFDGRVPVEYWRPFPAFVALAVVVYLSLHVATGLYGRVWLQAGPAEAWQLLVASAAAVALLMCVVLASADHVVPLSVPVNGGALAVLLLGGLRFHSRVLAARTARRALAQAGTGARVLLVGPCSEARTVLHRMLVEPAVGLLPVAIVTGDRAAWGRSLSGVPVCGPVDRLVESAARHGAEQVVLVPGGPEGEALRVADLAREAGLRARVLPSLRDSDAEPPLRTIRDLSIEDLLDREPVDVDQNALRSVIEGRTVLVTGAGGSIGREIAAQVARLDPAALLLLDHDETHLHDVVALLAGAPCVPTLGDIRDGPFLDALFRAQLPDVVFHAAAHKHVPILEDFPDEAVRTNVHGTDLLLSAALAHGTATFVAISTDKAVAPSSVMGASKRLAEQLLVHRRAPGLRYCAVRFGNVLGSRGSVVPTFVRQVAEGGPVTVTHADMTRFFMTIPEAVQLVMEAASRSVGGEVFMLDMGEPVRIVDLARRIITLSGQSTDSVPIRFTGLRPGEKLTEQLASDLETVTSTDHPKIMRVTGAPVPADVLRRGVDALVQLAFQRDQPAVRRLLLELAALPHEIDLDGFAVQALRSGATAAVARGAA